MVRFELTSNRDVLVSGIGLLPADQPVEVSEFQSLMFEKIQGVPLTRASFPAYVTLTAVLVDGGE